MTDEEKPVYPGVTLTHRLSGNTVVIELTHQTAYEAMRLFESMDEALKDSGQFTLDLAMDPATTFDDRRSPPKTTGPVMSWVCRCGWTGRGASTGVYCPDCLTELR